MKEKYRPTYIDLKPCVYHFIWFITSLIFFFTCEENFPHTSIKEPFGKRLCHITQIYIDLKPCVYHFIWFITSLILIINDQIKVV